MDKMTPTVIPTNLPLHTTNINEYKKTNYTISNSSVTFNLPSSQPHQTNTAEQRIAIQNFSTEYYQLLVTCDKEVFRNNVVLVAIDRALGQDLVPAKIFERCSSLSEQGIGKLKTFPAIICMENEEYWGHTDPKQFAVYAYIRHIQKEGSFIKLEFEPIDVFPQGLLCDNKYSIYFDLNMGCAMTDLNRSAWSVHKINLFKAFEIAGLGRFPHPI